MSFTCPRCGRESHNPNDERYGYCAACHDYTGDSTATYDDVEFWKTVSVRAQRIRAIAVTDALYSVTVGLLDELYAWAVDAAHQGAGMPMTDPRWHMFMATWEEADELLPRVAAFLGRPDPRGARASEATRG